MEPPKDLPLYKLVLLCFVDGIERASGTDLLR